MLTGKQIREARKLLGWGRMKFSRNALIPETLSGAIESSEGPAWLTDEQETSIRRACEGSGIRFEVDAEGQPAAVMTGALPTLPPPDILILRWLARRDHATAPAIGTSREMSPDEVRSRLAAMESLRLVASRQDEATTPPRRVYFATSEGRRVAGIVDTKIPDA